MRLRVVPQSLFGRLLLALLVTMSVTLTVIALLLVREWPEVLVADRTDGRTVDGLAADPHLFLDVNPDGTRMSEQQLVARMLVEDLAAQRRLEQAARRMPEEPSARFVVQIQGPVSGERTGAALELQAVLQRQLGEDFAVAVTPAEKALAPQAEASPARWSISLLVQLLVVALILGAVLYWTARTITRPLRELETAAGQVRRGTRFVPLGESGARELRSAARAFNTMQERLYRYLDSRALLLAAMSHDLRTPLTRLKLRLEALDDEQLRARCNADLDEMERLVMGALRLFKGVDHDEPFETIRVEDFLAALSSELAEIGWRVTASGSTIAPISARKDSLRRCLVNLISNAVKYGAIANVTVADEAGDVVVRVQDEGPGIPEAMLEKVFEPFFRLDDSRNVDTGGMGLGLSIARDVAQAHGGSLVLRNRSPCGLEATLRLPRSTTP